MNTPLTNSSPGTAENVEISIFDFESIKNHGSLQAEGSSNVQNFGLFSSQEEPNSVGKYLPTSVPEGPFWTLSHELAIGSESANGENTAFKSIDEEVQEKSKVFAFEKTALPAICMQDHAAKQGSSANLPLFKTRAPDLADNFVSFPSMGGDDSDDLSNFFEGQFQMLDGLFDIYVNACNAEHSFR